MGWWLPGAGGGGGRERGGGVHEELLLKGCEFQICKVNELWASDAQCGDDMNNIALYP